MRSYALWSGCYRALVAALQLSVYCSSYTLPCEGEDEEDCADEACLGEGEREAAGVGEEEDSAELEGDDTQEEEPDRLGVDDEDSEGDCFAEGERDAEGVLAAEEDAGDETPELVGVALAEGWCEGGDEDD